MLSLGEAERQREGYERGQPAAVEPCAAARPSTRPGEEGREEATHGPKSCANERYVNSSSMQNQHHSRAAAAAAAAAALLAAVRGLGPPPPAPAAVAAAAAAAAAATWLVASASSGSVASSSSTSDPDDSDDADDGGGEDVWPLLTAPLPAARRAEGTRRGAFRK
jgi:hypothetical protein